MKALIFDPFSGASGDMIVASLLDLGADAESVKGAMEGIVPREKVKVTISKVKKGGIAATRVNVTCKETHDRSYPEVVKIVEKSDLPDETGKDMLAIFEIMAKAESRIHSVPLKKLKFHEVGAADAIADVAGACTAMRSLGVGSTPTEIRCTTISVGGGFVETDSGKFPVPAPATLEILRNSQLLYQGGPASMELLTPTGAAILAHYVRFSDHFFPQVRMDAVGYGAGSFDLEAPNVLRTVLGTLDENFVRDEIEILETNVDDVTGEILGNLIEELLSLGAKDVAIIPAVMKKGRSGNIIQVLSKATDSAAIARKIIEETGSLGVRVIPTRHRLIALRRIARVSINIGGKKRGIDVKIASDLGGKVLNISAEFDDAKRIARETGVPVKDVIAKAEEEARKRYITASA
jgi:hypothetical protein